MNKAWDLKTADDRLVDNLYTFVIFCEDETSEVEYFKWFQTNSIRINIIPKQKSMFRNVVKAITHCKENKIINHEGRVIEGYDVWCVYDRDKDESDEAILEQNQEFNIAHSVAESHKINLAWSNDSFELWILLHLMDIDPEDQEFKAREKYYEILDNYFSQHPNPNERLIRILQHPTFSYKKDLKHRKNFIDVVRNEILPYTLTAIEKSKRILEFYNKDQPYNEWSPCTLVHFLVLRLLEKGGQVLPCKR